MSSLSSGPKNSPISIGETVGGKYRVVRLLGQGGMGAVYLVEHQGLGNEFALKILSGSSELHHARFAREARILASLRGEHVAKVVDFGVIEEIGSPYMVMEFLPGRDLSQLLDDRSEPLSVGEAVDHVLEACEALAEAHRAGIVHRDVKPSNLFLTTRFDGSPMVKVLDFGIAKTESTAGDDTALTATTMVFGSPAYMSPEQVRSSKRVGPQTDIWSMALVLYELVSKGHPFQGDSTAGIVAAIAADPPMPLSPHVGPGLWAALEPSLRKDPAERPQSIAAFAATLVRFGGERSRIVMARIERLAGHPASTGASRSETRPLLPSSPDAGSAPVLSAVRLEEPLPTSARTTMGGGRAPKSRLPLVLAGVVVVAVGAWVGMRSRDALRPAQSTAATEPAPPIVASVLTPPPPSSEPASAAIASERPAPFAAAPAVSAGPMPGGKSGTKGRTPGTKSSSTSAAPGGPGAPRQGEFN